MDMVKTIVFYLCFYLRYHTDNKKKHTVSKQAEMRN